MSIEPSAALAARSADERADVVDDAGSDLRPLMHGVSALVLAAGVVLTFFLGLAARSAHESNEDRLLTERTRQAAAVLTASLPGIQTPLASAAEVAELGDEQQNPFRQLMLPLVEQGRPFVSASLWRVDIETLEPVLVVGSEPKLLSQPPEVIRSFLGRALASSELEVIGLLEGDDPRLGYSYTSAAGPIAFVAYAEGALPPERTSVVRSDSAFAGLDNAVYLGDREAPDALLTASTSDLPLTGRRATEVVDFGGTNLLLVMKPTSVQGGTLLALLPWLVGAVGTGTTIGAALLTERVLRSRDEANTLANQNRKLYANQLSVARTLQQSLLPQELPNVEGVKFSARYLPGVAGLDIGGDWYDVIDLKDQVLVVVGDVSGRGLEAGTVMASLRYAIRAFASRGDEPATILDGLTRLLDLERDRHFATVLCATIDIADRSITIANAGHPAPLLVDSTEASFLATDVGPPIGVTANVRYGSTCHRVAPGATVLLFTDGLFERRGESVDAGMERLRQAVPRSFESLDAVIDGLLAHQITDESHDDTAIIGVRWTSSPTT